MNKIKKIKYFVVTLGVLGALVLASFIGNASAETDLIMDADCVPDDDAQVTQYNNDSMSLLYAKANTNKNSCQGECQDCLREANEWLNTCYQNCEDPVLHPRTKWGTYDIDRCLNECRQIAAQRRAACRGTIQ